MAKHLLETDGQVCPFPLVEAKRHGGLRPPAAP